MDKIQKYKPADKMSDLICDNYSLLQVMSRFGLSLGFGDKTVKEVCQMNGVDYRTFLTVVNFVEEGYSRMNDDSDDISILPMILIEVPLVVLVLCLLEALLILPIHLHLFCFY